MTTTQRRSWSRPLLVCVIVLLVAVIAAALIFQYLLEQKIQQQITTDSRFEGTVERVDYSLLSNRLTLSGITLKKRAGLPVNATCTQFTLEGIDRACLLAVLMDKTLSEVPPVLRLGDIDVQGLRVVIDNEIAISLEQRRVVNTSVDMVRIKALLDKSRSKNGSTAGLTMDPLYQEAVTCLSYDSGYGKNTQIALGNPEYLTFTVDEFTESQVEHGNFAHSELRGLSVTGNMGGLLGMAGAGGATQELGSIGRIVAEDFFCAPELLAADPETMTDTEALEYLKKVFLGEKPFIRKISVDNFRSSVMDATRVSLQNLTWENTSTSPFDCALSVTDLSCPAPSSASMLGYSRLDFSARIALKLPSRAAGPFSCDLFFDGKDAGVLTLQTSGSIADPGTLYAGDPNAASIAGIMLNVKDAGLLKRVERLSALFTGQQSLPAALDAGISTMPEGYRTPVNMKNLEAVRTFLEQSGSLKMTFAPQQPVSLAQFEDDAVFFNALEVTAEPAAAPKAPAAPAAAGSAAPAAAGPDTTK